MSTAAAAEPAVPVKSGKKKLILIIVLALVTVLAASGGVAVWLLKKQAHAEEDADADEAGGEGKGRQMAKRDPNSVPVFVALDNFTVNLADRDADRYAQIGISLELQDAKAGDRIKVFMPAIRNNILMVLAHKRSSDLLERTGKEQLASEVLRETERAMGIELGTETGTEADAPPAKDQQDDMRVVRAVHFSNFIIQ